MPTDRDRHHGCCRLQPPRVILANNLPNAVSGWMGRWQRQMPGPSNLICAWCRSLLLPSPVFVFSRLIDTMRRLRKVPPPGQAGIVKGLFVMLDKFGRGLRKYFTLTVRGVQGNRGVALARLGAKKESWNIVTAHLQTMADQAGILMRTRNIPSTSEQKGGGVLDSYGVFRVATPNLAFFH